MFAGLDNPEQLVKIVDIMGIADLVKYAKKYKIVLDRKEHPNLKR